MRYALLLLSLMMPVGLFAQIEEPNHVAPDGKTEAQVDYPTNLWIKNIGSRVDGSGMCVFSSAEMAARWCGHENFYGFRDWCANHYPGGGYPEKLDKLIAAYCKAKNIPAPNTPGGPDYVQYEGASMELATRALRNNQMVCSTLYHSPRYGGGVIYHMVNLAHWGPGGFGAVQDNNFLPYEWDTTHGMEPRLKMNGRVWLMIWKRHGPPPPPK